MHYEKLKKPVRTWFRCLFTHWEIRI